MKITYDPHYNIAYFQFREKSSEIESLKISDELVIDMTSDGKIYGIEFLNANEQLLHEDMGKFLFINESTGTEINLPVVA
jgi:uncharacterized protein YuzE